MCLWERKKERKKERKRCRDYCFSVWHLTWLVESDRTKGFSVLPLLLFNNPFLLIHLLPPMIFIWPKIASEYVLSLSQIFFLVYFTNLGFGFWFCFYFLYWVFQICDIYWICLFHGYEWLIKRHWKCGVFGRRIWNGIFVVYVFYWNINETQNIYSI